jgi:trigger factor
LNVTVTDVGPCKKLLRVEVGETEVEQGFVHAEKEIQKRANLPGFRKGKAPLPMILKAFEKEIKEEAEHKVVSESYTAAIKQENLAVFNLLNVEDLHLERGKPLQIVATIEVRPQINLPPYKGLPAKREDRSVAEAEIDHAIELLRARHATFEDLKRPAAPGDMLVVNYTGSCDGKPISEVAPDARSLAAAQKFWIELKEGAFLPGFFEQMSGVTPGTKRTVTVTFPADFPTPALAGKPASYEVEVLEVKERILPPVDDTFAQAWEARDVKGLREGVRQDLQNELNDKTRRSIREQVVRALVAPLNFDMPESAVLSETRNVVYEVVRENTKRGVSKDLIDKNKDEIFNMANTAAKERVKSAFVFARIAELEGIKVEPDEFEARLYSMAKALSLTPDKLLKELQRRKGETQLVEQILNEKVVDFLQQHAKIEDVPAQPAKA